MIDTFGPGTSLDVPTILSLAKRLWPEFVKPIIEAGVYDDEEQEVIFGRVNFAGLFAIGKRKGLFTGEDIIKQDYTFINTAKNDREGKIGTGKIGRGYELPYYTKFLLIAAFLASYNPTKDDTRIFSRDSGLKKKKRRAGQKSNKGIARVMPPQFCIL